MHAEHQALEFGVLSDVLCWDDDVLIKIHPSTEDKARQECFIGQPAWMSTALEAAAS